MEHNNEVNTVKLTVRRDDLGTNKPGASLLTYFTEAVDHFDPEGLKTWGIIGVEHVDNDTVEVELMVDKLEATFNDFGLYLLYAVCPEEAGV